MTVHVGVSGVHKDVEELHVGVSGVWKQITEGWVGVSGVWKQFYELIQVTLPATDFVASFTVGVNALAQYQLRTDGTIRGTQGGNTVVTIGDWFEDVTNPEDYDVRATFVSGESLTSGTLDTWLAIDTIRFWTLGATSVGGVRETVLTIEIRDGTTLAVLATCTVTIQCEKGA